MLIGHPEHDLLFIATQVARAAGLKDPSKSAQRSAALEGCESYRVREVLGDTVSAMRPAGVHAPLWHKMILMPEASTFQMLARGHAPQSQPFRDWVFKEVLPTIRKTGSYNVNESTTETGQQFAGELASLSDAVAGLLKQNATILGMLRRRQRGMLVNP